MAASMINPSGFFWLLVIAVLSFGLYVGMPLRWFSLHPICMLLAFGALAAGGIRFKREGGRQNTISHAWLMASSTAIALAGWYVIYEQKRMLEKPHNTSWHAWTGLVVIFGFATGTVGSWIALHPDTGLRKGNKRVRQGHKRLSQILTCFAWITLVSGCYKTAGLPATLLLMVYTGFLGFMLLT
mmetsp:Transcript_22427/g.48970  ORF Transcript_22427/g.48970 Transcript_22427/m.48970 type:complete len:184 (+) Transcript_22427:397-948(+)